MSAESPRHARSGAPLTVPSQPPSDRGIIDAVSGFINDVTLSSPADSKDVIQWARFETADINEPTPEWEGDNDTPPILLALGYGSGVQVWLVPPNGEAQEVLSWRQGTVRVLRILHTPQHGDCYVAKRPLIALCDSASPGPTFCSLSFISIRGGEQVKSIKFKNPILDVLANKRSIVISFSERFAVFDAATLEDRMAITTCYPCPCPLGGSTIVNPLALGDRWLAYADKKLNPSKRSSGGCEGEGVTSYTATVLHAAKSLSKGLRGLGETVAHSLAGTRSSSQSPSPPHADAPQPGVITILDIEGNDEDDGQDEEPYDPIVAHFVAHSEAVIALKFDSSGMLLVTADRRGHDFHVFRINPHPCGPSLASVHHLYVLHRGDTTAKVQDIAISSDSRWTAISTLRGTTHVFAISPYGGACGVRTHTQPRVVNRLSRFHRSAGLPIPSAPAGVSGSPVGDGLSQGAWFPNPRLPPYPAPTVVTPLAQLRPTANLPTHTITRTSSGRQRLSSLSEDASPAPLLARACFSQPPAGPSVPPSGASKSVPVAALYLMSAGGSLTHLLLHPRPARNIPKEKICDESPIELDMEPVAQWPLQRGPNSAELVAPLPPTNPLLPTVSCRRYSDMCMSEEERWLSQVEIVTHAGPHRRLWMGPQFVFKTYNFTGSNSSLSEAETVEVDTSTRGVARSNPVNMPGVRPIVPVLIDSGSASSLEHSPSDSFRRKSLLAETGRAASVCDVQLKEDLAEAMKEDHGWEDRSLERNTESSGGGVERAVDPLGTVVAPPRSAPPPPAEEDALANADEATFRPVVRAPALPLPPHMPVRPLPRTTTIPVQSVTPPQHQYHQHNHQLPHSLPTNVLIPAELTTLSGTTYCDTTSSLPAPIRRPIEDPPNTLLAPISASGPVDENVCSEENRQQTSCRETSQERIDISVTRNTIATVSQKQIEDIQIKNSKAKKETNESRDELEEIKKPSASADLCTEPLRVEDDSSSRIKGNCWTSKDSKIRKPKVKDRSSPSPDKERTPPTTVTDTVVSLSVSKPESFSNVSISTDKEKITSKEEMCVAVSLSLPFRKDKNRSKFSDDDIKTEAQAWDMLMNEAEKSSVLKISQPVVSEKHIEEPKPKTRKNRSKKNQDAISSKADEDSFIEIHNIEEKSLPSSGELVSISGPYEGLSEKIDDTSTHIFKAKSRSPKSVTPERNVEGKRTPKDNFFMPQFETTKETSENKSLSNISYSESVLTNPKVYNKKKNSSDSTSYIKKHEDGTVSETTSIIKETSKTIKSKSLSPCPDSRINTIEKKDVYVIDTAEMNFPEIQITKGSTRSRKRSPLQSEISTENKNISEKPVKTWSFVAASKKSPEVELKIEKSYQIEPEPCSDNECEVAKGSQEGPGKISLQEKLMELCKRSDIMVAECDAPTELTFVEEHHTVLQELPPLEPLNFGLDDFNLEVMRDSLLEVEESKITSPIFKINIDDILSTIKESTNKVTESNSAFNLIDLEKIPAKKEKGFSVIEHHKIMSQEVKVDDDSKEDKDTDSLEKSSDDDVGSPVISTDSDKEEKRNNGAVKIALPSSKQVVTPKSKKPRRKKK